MSKVTNKDLDPRRDEIFQQASQWLLKIKDVPNDEQLQTQFQQWIELDELHEEVYLEAVLLWLELDAAENEITAFESSSQIDVVETFTPITQRSRRGPYFGVSVALMSIVLMAFMLLPEHLWRHADYATATAERRVIELDDGSKVHLNAQSAVNVDYRDDRRNIELLYGEAFFEVAKDTERPFSVVAADVDAQALGTAFNIRLLNEQVETTLTEGKLRVATADLHNVVMNAGQRLTYHQGRQTLESDGYAYLPSWKRGGIRLDGMPLGDLVMLLNRYYAPVFKLLDPRLAEHEIHGVLPTDDLETLLLVMQSSLKIEYSRVTDQLVLLHR